MSKDPAALLFIDTWLVSTAEMDADCRGWYLNLLLHQYDKKSIKNDIETLASIAGVKFSEFKRFEQVFKQVLIHKFEINSEGRLENPTASEIIRKRETFKEKRSRSGKIGQVIKHALKIKGFDKYIDVLKLDLYDKSDEEIEQIDDQVLKQMLKLFINGKENKVKNIDYINKIIQIWCDCFYASREFEYELINIGKEKKAIGSLLSAYKRRNPKSNSADTLANFEVYFKFCLNIKDNWLHQRMSPSMIVSQYSVIEGIYKNGEQSKTKQPATSDQDLARIADYFFAAQAD